MSQHDMVVDNGTGAVVLADMNLVLKALASCSSGATEPATMYAGMFWLDTTASVLRQRNRDNTAWTLVAGVPDKASAAEAVAGVSNSKYLSPLGVAQQQFGTQGCARNRLVNPAMQISQENGDTPLTVAGYPVDQWTFGFAGGAHSVGRVALVTPSRSPKRLRWTVTTIKAVLAAGDLALIYQPIEGIRVADFLWGGANARRVILRFGFKGPAGTYCMSIRNGGGTRSYIATFTISAGQANADTEQVFAVPGDITGSWAVDNNAGIFLGIVLACGTTAQGVAGWQAGNLIATAAQSNGMAALNTFELFDVGLYLDLSGSGVAPRWQFPDEPNELRACQRYYVQAAAAWSNYTGAIATYYTMTPLPVDMRGGVTPSFTTMPSNNSQSAVFTAVPAYVWRAPRSVQVGRPTNTATTTAAGFFFNTFAASARM